jgi:CRISPR-associated protein Csd1
VIAELLDLSSRLGITTPAPFQKVEIHYLIDLDLSGNPLAITRVCANIDAKGKSTRGKVMECPAYFPLKIKTDSLDEILASAGGGVSVAELGHGDIKEIFRTEIKFPKGKPPQFMEIVPPANGENIEPPEEADDEEPDADNSGAGGNSGKNQYYRHENWLKLINDLIAYSTRHASTTGECQRFEALASFFSKNFTLGIPAIMALLETPDPASKEYTAKLKQLSTARLTFRTNGHILVNERLLKKWWSIEYGAQRDAILKVLPEGDDGYATVDHGSRRLTPVFPHIGGIPNGGMYCPLASFDKATSRSYGLEKNTLSMSLTTAERAGAALSFLLRDQNSQFPIGGKGKAVFWAVPNTEPDKLTAHNFASLLNEPDPLQVLDFFRNIHGQAAASPDHTQFYCAILSSPKSRITVRSWHTTTLDRVTLCAEQYFRAITLPNLFKSNVPTVSTLFDLADAIVPPKGKSGPPPFAYESLIQTALFGDKLSNPFLQSAVQRQGLELANGYFAEKELGEFEARLRARAALIKLYFYSNHKIIMNETTHATDEHPAYLCGRVLAVLDSIHNAAHEKITASSPASRYYGSASSTPALVFPRLCKFARIHLDKIKNPKTASDLDHNLTRLVAKFAKDATWPRTLALEDQGRFAIGFYYERSRQHQEPSSIPEAAQQPAT